MSEGYQLKRKLSSVVRLGDMREHWACVPTAIHERGPDHTPAVINPRTHEIVWATPERRALIEAHRRRVQEGMRVHGKR